VKSENYTIFYSGCERGVGFIIIDTILPHVKGFTLVSDSLCVLKLEGNLWNIIVVNCYAPTEDDSNDIKKEIFRKAGKNI
jgi:hypothetical protein